MHVFYLIKENKTIRFDIVISFNAKNRNVVYQEVFADVQRAFSYKLPGISIFQKNNDKSSYYLNHNMISPYLCTST